LPLSNLHTTTLDYHMQCATYAFKIDLQTDTLPHMASQPPKTRERNFRNIMRKNIRRKTSAICEKDNSTMRLAYLPDSLLRERLHTCKLPENIYNA